MKYNFFDAKGGTMLEDFYPSGWDAEKINKIMSVSGEENFFKKEDWWNEELTFEKALDRNDWAVKVGFRIAWEIIKAKEEGKKIALLIPFNPVKMYGWAAKFLKTANVSCDHVYTFAQSDFADAEGNVDGQAKVVLEKYFFNPLGDFTVPFAQRYYATKEQLPLYADKIDEIKAEGGRVVFVYTIGRSTRIADWEPQWAANYASEEEFLKENYRLGGGLHPISILEYSMYCFKGNFAAVPARVNSIGFGIIMKADVAVGGAHISISSNQRWQTLGAWLGLHYGPNPWVPTSYLPTIPGMFINTRQTADIEVDDEKPYALPIPVK